MQVLWFKRDLRVQDHEALWEAARRGPVLPLYILEPALWKQPDMSHRHYLFLKECLKELDADLKSLGQGLVVRVGEACEVLQQLHARHQLRALWSHQETWNDWTYRRDQAVRKWTRAMGVLWHEPVQNGVLRRLKDRDGWAARWHGQMSQPVLPAPEALHGVQGHAADPLPSSQDLGLHEDACHLRQSGGRRAGLAALKSFLHSRGEAYTKEMSSPVTAFESCSRISPHLAFGTLSMREVFQQAQLRSQEIKARGRGQAGKWPSALRSFSGRLRWHCHFIQKLEDEPRIEFENMHRAYDGLRDQTAAHASHYLEAWKTGQTGYPMVDACMRALIATGWLNFRMRAMLMSFASYHLWLHWRPSALHLARLFTDYEPGIHYSQAQMQSGTTGINSIRIYNPVKQSLDQDPDGHFIRKWIPEIAHIDPAFIHRPWEIPAELNGYPMPIVEEERARKAAAAKLYAIRRQTTHRDVARGIARKHGSRKSGLVKTKRPKLSSQASVSAPEAVQDEFPL